MRPKDRILSSLESTYREAFDAAKERDDEVEMARLDFEFQRDQIHLEVLLDLRALLSVPRRQGEERTTAPAPKDEKSLLDEGTALLEKAQKLRRITKLR